jgi:hypothetical protein
MFNFGEKWYTSTHRKLDAFRSKWSSRESFGDSFKRCLQTEYNLNEKLRKACSSDETVDLMTRFQSTLDVNKQYMFLVRNNDENRIVCDVPSQKTSGLFHVGTFVNGQLVLDEDVNIPHSKRHSFKNLTELTNYVRNIDIREKQGVILFGPRNRQYKVVNKKYQDFFNIRGNEPSVKFRYLQLRMDSQKLDMLYKLYPNMHSVFEKYETTIYDIARKIHTSYRERHVKKQWMTLPKEEYIVDCACHRWHLETKLPVTVNIVMNVMNEQSATNLNRMIRRHNEEINPSNHNNQKPRSPLLLSKNPNRNPGGNSNRINPTNTPETSMPEVLVLGKTGTRNVSTTTGTAEKRMT